MKDAAFDKSICEIILNFAKAKTSDEASLKFIADVQKLFNLPHNSQW